MTDDLWLKAMSVMNHTQAVRIPQKAKIYMTIIKTQKVGLHYDNVGNNKNDIALKKIIERYKDIETIIGEDGYAI